MRFISEVGTGAAAVALLLALSGCGNSGTESVKSPPSEVTQAEPERAGTGSAFETAVPADVEGAPEGAECPTAEVLTQTIATTFRKGITVKEVGPGPFPGLCETVISYQGRTDILYSDKTGRYFVTGRSVGIVDTEGRVNLTHQRLSEFNRFTAEDMEKVASLTALSMGNKGPVVYFVTDPQ